MNSRPSNSPDLPDLPPQYDEIKATAKSGSTTRLEDYIEDLPGLNTDRFTVLSNIAHTMNGSKCESANRGGTVLALIRSCVSFYRQSRTEIVPDIRFINCVESSLNLLFQRRQVRDKTVLEPFVESIPASFYRVEFR